MITRRRFLGSLAAASTAVWRTLPSLAARRAPGDIRFGYAAITWAGDDLTAIDEIAAVGFKGIQLRASILQRFGDRPEELKALLGRRSLTMVALSSGNVLIDPAAERADLEKHAKHARFVRDVGGLYLQVTDERPKARLPAAEDFKRMGRLLTEIGKRCADVGVALGYHHHMGNLGERPEEVRAVLGAADPRFVKLLLDTAHYQMGGGDPVAAVMEYRERLLFLHIKDLETPVPGLAGDASPSYRFVELGRGKVDIRGVLDALLKIGFKGWAIVELDRVPDDARTPRESALMARHYLEKIGQRVE